MNANILNGSILDLTPRSPFARRVRITLLRLGIDFKEREVAPFEPSADFLDRSPLGTVPVLELSNGEVWPDSATILDNLYETVGGIWPDDLTERRKVRQAAIWAEGLMSAAVSFFLEGQRKNPDPAWTQDFRDVVERTLKKVDSSNVKEFPWISGGNPTQAGWDLGVALEYLSLRMPDYEWTKKHPSLVAHLEVCRQWDRFRATTPPPM